MAKRRKSKKKPVDCREKNLGNKSPFRLIWDVIRNRENTEGYFIKTTFVLLMEYLLNVFFILLGLLSIIGVYSTIREIFVLNWDSISLCIVNVVIIALLLIFCIVVFLFAILLKGFANDIGREKDKDYIVAIFSGIVSFIALIVAVIALLRG